MRDMNLVLVLFLIPAISSVACPPAAEGGKIGRDGLTRCERRQYHAAIDRGDAFYQNGFGDLAAADRNYRIALDLSPNDPPLLLKLGLCTLNGPHPADAWQWLAKAEAIDPDLRNIHFLMGACLQANGRWDEAIVEFEQHRITLLRTPDPDATFNVVDERIEACRAAKYKMTRADGDVLINAEGANEGPTDECEIRRAEPDVHERNGSTTRIAGRTGVLYASSDAWSAPVACMGMGDGHREMSMHADQLPMKLCGDASCNDSAQLPKWGGLKMTWSLLPIDPHNDGSQAQDNLDLVALRRDFYSNGSKDKLYSRREILKFIKGLHMMEAIDIQVIGMDMQDVSIPACFRKCHGTSVDRSMDQGHDMTVRVEEHMPNTNHAHTELTRARTSKVYFTTNSVAIDTVFDAMLDRLVSVLLADPALQVVIDGHSDGDAKGSDNTALSIARANVVKDYLIGHGVAAHRLVTKASGATRPQAPNDTPAHMALNRRTEITVQ